ncbi:MAG: DUF2510 domain-containing protein [Actinomycetota bacterium]|nr:DUF2510 domain-containing protein [Actinomycetota bacterium]
MGEGLVVLLAWLLPIGVLVWVASRNWNRGSNAAPPPHPGARWAKDPTGRHELRLWDGQQWTANISNHGVSGWDPLR